MYTSLRQHFMLRIFVGVSLSPRTHFLEPGRFYFPIVRFSAARTCDTTCAKPRETRTQLWPLDDVTTQQQRRRRDLFGRAPNRQQ